MRDLGLVGRSLGASRWITAASPDYLERYGTPTKPGDLSQGHLLIGRQLSTGRTTEFRFERDRESFSVDGLSSISVNESNAHLAAGLAGLGVLQSFEWKLRAALRSGALTPILLDWGLTAYSFHVLYPPNRFMSTRLRVFIDWVVDVFDGLDGGQR